MLLEELADIPVSNIVMVGDREHDVLGAKEHGIACVGVLMVMEPCGAGAGAGNDNLPDAGSTADLSVMEFLQNIFS